jgi:hypothetical protein
VEIDKNVSYYNTSNFRLRIPCMKFTKSISSVLKRRNRNKKKHI